MNGTGMLWSIIIVQDDLSPQRRKFRS